MSWACIAMMNRLLNNRRKCRPGVTCNESNASQPKNAVHRVDGTHSIIPNRLAVVLLLVLPLAAVAIQTATAASDSEWPDDFPDWPSANTTPCGGAKTNPDAFWAKLESSAWVAVGDPDAPRTVYAFGDPNCIYCYKFWMSAQPWVNAGLVQLRYIPVGILGNDSTRKAATILMAADPVAALTRQQQQFLSGSVAPATRISAAAQKQLRQNESLLQELGFSWVPAIIGRDQQQRAQCWPGLPAPGDLKYIMGPIDNS